MRSHGAVGCALALLVALPAIAAPELTTRQKEIVYMVREDCGSCHGLLLKGGLGPAILPENLAGKDPQALARIILDGSPGTAMPPWRPMLSEAEASWIVDQLRKGFPDAR
ncbi:MAG TPA: cytochrome c [Stenomitos sp.]